MSTNPDPDDPRVRLRCFIAGKLVDEVWLDISNPDGDAIFQSVLLRHMALAGDADKDGKPWMVECYDPAKPAEQAYQRVGTDTEGMVDPQPIPPGWEPS